MVSSVDILCFHWNTRRYDQLWLQSEDVKVSASWLPAKQSNGKTTAQRSKNLTKLSPHVASHVPIILEREKIILIDNVFWLALLFFCLAFQQTKHALHLPRASNQILNKHQKRVPTHRPAATCSESYICNKLRVVLDVFTDFSD